MDMPVWASKEGPWCLKQWIPFNTPNPKVMVCLRNPDHEGDCKDQTNLHHNQFTSLFVGELQVKDNA